MKNRLAEQITDVKRDLLAMLNSFSQENINQKPFDGSWTAGQVAEHVLKSASGVLGALTGLTKSPDRDPEQFVKRISNAFMNFDVKMKSTDFILPSEETKDKNYLLKALETTFDGIEKVADTDDLTQICTTFEMPAVGYLSRSEFLNFTIVHTRRHIYQLKNILSYFETSDHDNAKPIHQF